MIPTMVIGGSGELVGWAGRYWSSQNPNSYNGFIMQITTTIFACVQQAVALICSDGVFTDSILRPTFMTAANFIILGRTIAYSNGQIYARLTPRKCTYLEVLSIRLRMFKSVSLVTKVFLFFDILCLFIQCAGGGIASSNNAQQVKVGTDIALVGIAAQTGKCPCSS